jgi:putative transposase
MMSSEIVQDPQDLQSAPGEGPGLAGGAPPGEPVPGDTWRQELAEELIGRARSEGVQLTGPGGLLTGITQRVLETALETELADHLGYDKGDPAGRGSPNMRNGHSPKTVHTDAGPVRIAVPRDRAGSFEPLVVPKHARRVGGFDTAILSLYAKGLTTGEIQAHLAEVYGAGVSRELVSKVTDAVNDELAAWRNRPLDRIYAVLFVDAIMVKIRDGTVANRPVYLAVGVSLDGDRDVLGMWAGTGGEGAKQWLAYLSELKNRGAADVFIVCTDGLKGMGEAIEATWPAAIHQTCVVHLVRHTLRLTARKDWQHVTPGLRAIYTAPTAEAAAARFAEFAGRWGSKYPAVIRTWQASWEKFTPFLAFDPEIRTVVYTTNMIESLNARFRQAIRRRGHFPNEQAALKVLYLVIRDKKKGGGNITARITSWKKALNAFAIAYGDRIDPQ